MEIDACFYWLSTTAGSGVLPAVMQVNLNDPGCRPRGGLVTSQFDGRYWPFGLITRSLIKDVIPFGLVDAIKHADTTIKTIVVVNIYRNLRSLLVYFPELMLTIFYMRKK